MKNRQSRTNFELALLFGWALWLSIAVFNNIIDFDTNIFHLKNMLTMKLLQEDGILGQGLLWKSISQDGATYMLCCVIFAQILVCVLLWRAAFNYLLLRLGLRDNIIVAKKAANLSLTAFLVLWMFFLCGGLWFGYWIKQGAIQSVHMTLVIISIGIFITLNLPEEEK